MSRHPSDAPLIDNKKMQEVFNYHKLRIPWNKIQETYDRWEDVYKHDRVQSWTLVELLQLKQVFHFTGTTFLACKNQFTNWLSKHQEFYNDDINVICQRMQRELDNFNTRTNLNVPYLNWLPQFGGLIQASNPRAEIQWRQKNQVPFELDGNIPGRKNDK